jgi:hypothetical protein
VEASSDIELVAQEMSRLAEMVRTLQERVGEVEKVNARLEVAALITARSLQEISSHWNAVYEAMRRAERIEGEGEEEGEGEQPGRAPRTPN